MSKYPDAGTVIEGISVCILTFRRPEMLRKCVESVFANAARPIEIVICDNDRSPESVAAVGSLQPPSGIVIRHIANRSRTTQSSNAQCAFRSASFERLILMHDDDFLIPGGIDLLSAAWDAHDGNVDAVYGPQYTVGADGTIDREATKRNTRLYFKSGPFGVQQSRLWAALVQQFPNDSMLIRRSIAIKAGYPSEVEVGQVAIDLHFGIRYALASSKPFVMIPEFVAAYRMSAESVLRGNPLRRIHDGHLGYRVLEAIPVSSPCEAEAREIALRRFSFGAVLGYLTSGKPGIAAVLLRKRFWRMETSLWHKLVLLLLVGIELAGLRLMPRLDARARRHKQLPEASPNVVVDVEQAGNCPMSTDAEQT